jgi:hypothetical protein
VPEKIQAQVIKTSHVKSQDQLADIFTKALGKEKHLDILCKLGQIDIYLPT